MGLSAALLLIALGAAFSGTIAGLSRTTVRSGLFAALSVSATFTLLAIFWLSSTREVDAYGFAHQLYLAATVTVPVMAGAGLVAPRILERRWLQTRRATGVMFLGIVPALVGIYGTHFEPDRLTVEYVTVTIPGIEPVRLAVLADLQTPNVGTYEHRVVERILEQEPDIVLIPGDLWQMSRRDIADRWPQFRDLLNDLTDGVGHVVIVEGDSDNFSWLQTTTKNTEVHFLDDETVVLNVRGAELMIGGIRLRDSGPTAAIRAVLAELENAPNSTTTILLSHRPGVAHDPIPGSVDLVVAGHTHGGQLALPFVGPPFTNADVPRSVAAGGLHEVNGQPIYVSSGVGMVRGQAPQVRLGVTPSVGVIDLQRAD